MKSSWSLSAALAAAGAASFCCTIPLVLVSLGVGGAWVGSLTALAPYRWIFVTVALVALTYAEVRERKMSLQPDCDCETIFSSGTRRSFLGLGALAVVMLVVSPWLITPTPSAAPQHARATPTGSNQSMTMESSPPSSSRQIILTIEGMTCQTCPITVRKALEGVGGVYEAQATLEPPRATVRFDPAKVSVKTLTTATKDAGFPSQVKSPS